MEEKENGLTAEENAYFESEGETSFEKPAETVEKPETVEEKPVETEEQKAQGRDERGRFVPHQALHAEREEHKRTRAELNEMRDRQTRLETLWQSSRQEPEPEIPDEDQDPMAAIKWVVKTVKDAQQSQRQQAQEYQQRSQEEQQVQAAVDYVDQDYNRVIKEDPSVQEAYHAAFDSYAKELQVLGYRGQQFNQEIARTLRNFQLTAAQQMQQGVSLGDFIKGVASTRGWQAKAIDPANIELPGKLKDVAKAQDASRTIGKTAGKAGGDEISIDDLSRMPQSEFNAWIAEPANEKRFQKLMGG